MVLACSARLPLLVLFGLGISLCSPSAIWAQDTSLKMEAPRSRSTKKAPVRWTMSSRAVGYEEGPDSAQLVQFSLNPQMDLRLHRLFQIEADAALNLNSGRVQSRFADPTTDNITLNHLALKLRPHRSFQVQAGALNQSDLGSELFISNRAFPAVRLLSGYKSKSWTVMGHVQGAIPTSTSLDNDRQDSEATPSLTTQTVGFKLHPNPGWGGVAKLTRFQFSDLPSIVAFESGRRGNLVTGVERAETDFTTEFAGWVQSYELYGKALPWMRLRTQVQIVENLEAPSDQARAQMLSLGTDLSMGSLTLSPAAGRFYSEASSTPALYSSPAFGHNNRVGEFYDLGLKFKDLGFLIRGQAISARVIDPDPVQNDLMSYALWVETQRWEF